MPKVHHTLVQKELGAEMRHVPKQEIDRRAALARVRKDARRPLVGLALFSKPERETIPALPVPSSAGSHSPHRDLPCRDAGSNNKAWGCSNQNCVLSPSSQCNPTGLVPPLTAVMTPPPPTPRGSGVTSPIGFWTTEVVWHLGPFSNIGCGEMAHEGSSVVVIARPESRGSRSGPHWHTPSLVPPAEVPAVGTVPGQDGNRVIHWRVNLPAVPVRGTVKIQPVIAEGNSSSLPSKAGGMRREG